MNWSELAVGILGTGLVFAVGAGCAYALAAACLRVVMGVVTREQYNVNDCSPKRPHS